ARALHRVNPPLRSLTPFLPRGVLPQRTPEYPGGRPAAIRNSGWRSLGRRRSGPLSYEGMLPAARQGEVIIDIRRSGRSSARLECSVRDREVGSSNLLAPTPFSI